MKKKLIVIGSIALALAVLAGGAYIFITSANPWHVGDLTGYAERYPVLDREIAPMYVDSNGEFVILQFTDTHLVNGRGNDKKTFEMIAHWTDEITPDLVVISGDLIEGRGSMRRFSVDRHAALRGIAEIFENREQPWAYIPGNNEHDDYLGSASDVAAFLARYYEYVILSNEAGLPGATHFLVPLLYEDGNLAHELIFMDSLSRNHDAMEQAQADWLTQRLGDLGAQAPLARASVFFHHQTPVFNTALRQGEFILGDAYTFESIWGRDGSYIIDDAMQSAGNVGLVSIGHLHPSTAWAVYMGTTYYQIVRASGYQRGDEAPGGAVITIFTDDGNPRRHYAFEDIVF